MAKRYYWLKLKEDFFEEDTISWLEEQRNGKEYSLFYLKLCLKSLKTNGVLVRNVGDMFIPYDAMKLSKITNTDVDTVKVAMDLFVKIGLVQVLDNGEIYLSQLENMIGSETSVAERVRKHREKSKIVLENSQMLQCNNNVTKKKQKSNIDIDKEKDIDIEKDIDKEKDIEKDNKKKEKTVYYDNEELNELFLEFLNVRKKVKAVNSERAIKMLLNKLDKYSDEEKVQMINNSIINSWKDVYEIKASSNKKTRMQELEERFLNSDD